MSDSITQPRLLIIDENAEEGRKRVYVVNKDEKNMKLKARTHCNLLTCMRRDLLLGKM